MAGARPGWMPLGAALFLLACPTADLGGRPAAGTTTGGADATGASTVDGDDGTITTTGHATLGDGYHCSLAVDALVDLVVIDDRTCALDRDGCLWCWGDNRFGKLGLGHTSSVGQRPGDLDRLASVDIGGRSLTRINGGLHHTCALDDRDTALCWGSGGGGLLGIGNVDAVGDDPGEMGAALVPVMVPTSAPLRDVVGGGVHTCALDGDGALWCFGSNDFGTTGRGAPGVYGRTLEEMAALEPIEVGTAVEVVGVFAGQLHTCALDRLGTVRCWGANSRAQLGNGGTQDVGTDPAHMGDALVPVDFGPGTVRSVAIGYDHGCALLGEDTVRCWGRNAHGELGIGSRSRVGADPGTLGDNMVPAQLPELGSPITRLEAGVDFTCLLTEDGRVMCWGAGASGIAGVGTFRDIGDEPEELRSHSFVDIADRRVVQLARAQRARHMCARLDDDTLRCWGYNAFGQLGIGHTNAIGDGPGEMGEAWPITLSAG